MAIEFHLIIHDDGVAQRKGEPGTYGVSLHGLTATQAQAALPYVDRFAAKLREFLLKEGADVKKYGDRSDGQVIPEPGDDQRIASANFTDKDREELAEENADDLEGVAPI